MSKMFLSAAFVVVAFVALPGAFADVKNGRKVSVKSIARVLSLKESVSVRATTCAIKVKSRLLPVF